MDEQLGHKLRGVVRRWRESAAVERIEQLTPDASLRRYFRLHIKNEDQITQTLVAMVFDSVKPAEAAGPLSVQADDAYVSLTQFFSENGIAVPQLYFDARDASVLLIEDLGDCLLGQLLLGAAPLESGTEIETLYRAAIDQIIKIQRIEKRPGFFVFERKFSEQLYEKEMEEFIHYYLKLVSVPENKLIEIGAIFNYLAKALAALPGVLCHRDFHSWNLIVDLSGRIRVIDFQDALLASRPYDLVGLLNDRDTDSALGQKRYLALYKYFLEQSKYTEEFHSEYDLVLLQRDIKVVGRFRKLAKERGLRVYEQWVPGTLRRIGRTLERIVSYSSRRQMFGQLLELLESYSPEVKEGKMSPLRIN